MAKKKAAAKRAMKAAPLLQYLVTIQHSMDDVPIRLTDNEMIARGVAMSAPKDGMIPKSIMKALRISKPTTPCNVSIITFRNGIPVNREIVREYQ